MSKVFQIESYLRRKPLAGADHELQARHKEVCRQISLEANLLGRLGIATLPVERDLALDPIKFKVKSLVQEARNLKLRVLQQNYPEIDLSFLSMFNRLTVDGCQISVPRFSVYHVYGKNTFELAFERRGRVRPYVQAEVDGRSLESEICQALLGSTDIIKSADLKQYSNYSYENARKVFRSLPRDIRETYLSLTRTHSVRLVSTLNVLVPENIKRKIKDAETFFDRALYFVAETPASEWSIDLKPNPKPTRDPLIIGKEYVPGKEDKYRLIGKFDCGKMEEWVASEFSS